MQYIQLHIPLKDAFIGSLTLFHDHAIDLHIFRGAIFVSLSLASNTTTYTRDLVMA
jgi:hypothetical protein